VIGLTLCIGIALLFGYILPRFISLHRVGQLIPAGISVDHDPIDLNVSADYECTIKFSVNTPAAGRLTITELLTDPLRPQSAIKYVKKTEKPVDSKIGHDYTVTPDANHDYETFTELKLTESDFPRDGYVWIRATGPHGDEVFLKVGVTAKKRP